MRFFYDNVIDRDGVIVSASSEVRTLPASNVLDEQIGKPWRTKATAAQEWIMFDLGAATSVAAVIIAGSNFNENDSDFYLEGNSTPDFSAPAFSELMGSFEDGGGHILAGSPFYRYYRIRFTKWAGDLGSRQIGRIFLGGYYQTTEGPDFDGYDEQKFDLVRKQKSLGGQTFSENVARGRTLSAQFSKCKDNQVSWFETIYDVVGEGGSFFIQMDQVAPLADYIYVKLGRPFKRQVSGFDSSLYWDVTLSFEEQL